VLKEGEVSANNEKAKTFPRPFSTVERKHLEVQQLQGSWCQGGSGGRRFFDHPGLAGSIWILVFVWGNENDGKTFFCPSFLLQKKKHLNLSNLSILFFRPAISWGFWLALGRVLPLKCSFKMHFSRTDFY